MANEFVVRKGLIVKGSGSSTVLDVQGSQGQLFSITDSLSGSIFSANDISGIPVIEAFSDNTVKLGTFGAEGIIVSGSYSYITGSVTGSFTGSLLGTASYSVQNISSSYAATSSYTFNAISSSFASTASYVNPLRQDVQITGSLNVSGSGKFYKSSTDYVDLLTEANSISFSPNAASYIKYGSTIILAMKSGGGNSTVMYGAGTSILSATQFGVKIGRNVDGANSTSMLEVLGSGSSASSTGLKILNANNSASFIITDDGSSRLGFEYNDTHIITGSVSINGSGSNIPLTINGRNLTSSTANKVFEVIGSSGTSVFSPRSNGLVYIATGQLYFEQNGLTSRYYDSRLELGTSIINSASISANPQLYGGLRVFTWDGATTNIETFRVAGTGNVSIGYPSTFTNNGRLHISGSTSETLLIASSSAGPVLFVSGSGNVGFGTTTPTEKVHVVGNITGSGTLGIRNTTTLWGGLSLYGGNNNTSFGLDYQYTGSLLGKSNVLQFRQGGSTPGAIMFTYYGINSMLTMIPSDFPSARVGINTPNPQATLHVSGSSGSVVFEVDSDSSPNIIYASGSGNVGFGTSSPQRRVHIDGSGSSNTDVPLILTSVDSNNRVGILIASSSLSAGRQHKLYHRNHTPVVEWMLSANPGENAVFNFLPLDNTNFGMSLSIPRNGGTSYLYTGISQSLFSIGAGGITPQHINISSSGNVGFGTTTPTEKVHVVGNGLFTGDLTVQGKITAEEFHTEFVSASIIYRSGSTKFGDTSDDTHQFTGSLQVSGSITGSLFGTSSYAVSSSYAITASYANVAAEVLNPYYAVFTQSVASTTWTFNHNLGQRTPVITIYDNNYKVVIPESIQGTSQNQTVITFSSPQSGYASATMGSVLPSNQESLALVYAIVL